MPPKGGRRRRVQIESGAGLGANWSDADYGSAGASIVDKKTATSADLILKVG